MQMSFLLFIVICSSCSTCLRLNSYYTQSSTLNFNSETLTICITNVLCIPIYKTHRHLYPIIENKAHFLKGKYFQIRTWYTHLYTTFVYKQNIDQIKADMIIMQKKAIITPVIIPKVYGNISKQI